MFPENFTKQMQSLLGDEAELFFQSQVNSSPTCIRINPKKKNNFSHINKILWSKNGFYLNERPVFTLDPLFHAGVYYVQEASSMFLEQIIKQLQLDKKEIRALDLCAAPGGKTTHLLSLLDKNSLVVSNEVIRSRVTVLKENVIKWGYANCFVTSNEAGDFSSLENYFDVIVCDAPCSGEGLFRKDKNAIAHWSAETIEHCCGRQKKIVDDVLPALKPGGFLIYSTCTYNESENEKIVEWLNEKHKLQNVEIDVSNFQGIVKNKKTIRFFPHKINGEGFSVSVLQKPENDFASYKKIKSDLSFLPLNSSQTNFLHHSNAFVAVQEKNTEHFLNKNHVNDISLLSKHLNLIHYGLPAFENKGDDKIPLHNLAMSVDINPDAFPKINFTKQEALKYLKGETNFSFAGNAGFYLVLFENTPLGFLKKIKNRCNNLYPRNWFIRMNI